MNKRVNQDKQVNEWKKANKTGDKRAHPLDTFKDVKDEVVAQNDKVHVVKVDFDVEQGVSRVVDWEGNVDWDRKEGTCKSEEHHDLDDEDETASEDAHVVVVVDHLDDDPYN